MYGFAEVLDTSAKLDFCRPPLVIKVILGTSISILSNLRRPPNTPARGASTAADSFKHAFSAIEGEGRSGRQKGEGFGERGCAGLPGVVIYRPGWWSKVLQQIMFGRTF